MKRIVLLLLIGLLLIETNGQNSISTTNKVYKLNYKIDLPLTGSMFALNFLGFAQLDKKPTLDSLKIISLNKDDIWSFDRRAVNQSFPEPSNIYTISDIGLWTSYALPVLLFLDNEIRKDWLDITIMYFETQAINLNIYVWGGPVFTKRIRPIVYYEESSWKYKLGKETTDSFFSGHVSMAAGASFFMAKVYSDYHPELGAKKWLLYSAAIIPPAFVGYCRYKGYMHFPSDILIGAVVGAAVGISVPHIHKITRKMDDNLSIVPFTGNYSGISISMRF
ncbi:MAG: phosphatase PAP2 family protein [Bacteroidales bacterium]|nr:MAG: phosphatase PAP2 family protein [Bacteroidales bacterium]